MLISVLKLCTSVYVNILSSYAKNFKLLTKLFYSLIKFVALLAP